MTLKVEWRHFSTGDVFDITDRINLTDAAFSVTENAEEMTVGASTLIIDDPDGDFDIPGHSYIRITETDAPDDKVIWAGFVTIRHIKRATGFLTGPQRTWTGNLDDVNTVLARRILSEDDDADRPAETDVERIQWLFDEGFLGVLDTYFNTANPVDMDASNLVGMTVYDAVNDCLLQSGKNAWQQDISDGMGGFIGFTWYDFAASTVLSSDLQISNYISDITAEVGAPSPSGAAQTWYGSLDIDMERDPTRIYWKVRGQYDGGTVTRTRPATAVNFAARETTASWPLVKTATKANARADRYLLDISTEEDVITTTIWVHPDHVNDARAGRRVQARFQHLPGYEDWTWMRILNRTVTFETPEVYRIQYTLSPGSINTPAGTCTTISASMQTWDSGQQGSLNPSVTGPPVDVAPDSPSVYPSAVVGGFFTHRGDDTLGTDPVVTGLTVQSGGLNPNYAGTPRVATMGYAGFEHLAAGSPGTWELDWTVGNGGTERWRAMTVYIPTAAATPVQTGVQYQTGGTITLGAPPTVGNILVLVRMVETSAFASVPTGFVQQVAGSFHTSSPGDFYIDICTRCVQEGDSATLTLVDTSFSHWQYVQEWAIT